MNEQPNPNKSPKQKKKRSFWWLKLLLVLILFAAGIVAGVMLSSQEITAQVMERFFPQYAVTEQLPAPTATPEASPIEFKPVASPKPTPSPVPSKAPVEIVSPAEKEKEEEKKEETKTPEETVAPEESVAPQLPLESPAVEAFAPAETKPVQAEGYIGVDAALEAALKHAGLEGKEVFVYGVSREKDDGLVYYELEFEYEGRGYEYEINAFTGQVESWKIQRPEAVKNDGATAPAAKTEEATYVSAEEALAAALEHAGYKQHETTGLKTELEIDRNKPVYDIEFWAEGYDYDYKVDAQSGQVIMVEKERD
jgi:uncharacterized membrane protein YkoI